MALKDKRLPAEIKVDQALAASLRSLLREGTLSCAAAFAAAKTHGVSPLLIGQAADALQIRLSCCQLGLFGFPGRTKSWEADRTQAPDSPEGLEAAILAGRDREGNLSCAAAWETADRFGIPRARVGREADRMGVRIKHCQLGAF